MASADGDHIMIVQGLNGYCKGPMGCVSKDVWDIAQAPTQFQGEGSSHELAALLLTMTIHWSILNKYLLFVLLLGAKLSV